MTHSKSAPRRARGFTLVELMVVVALAAIIIATVAPSLRRLIEVQRVRAVNAQLVVAALASQAEAEHAADKTFDRP